MAKVLELEDRRYQLFGREPDIKSLVDCASESGITSVLARPKMGKTWTLIEVGRLLNSKGYIVGYHEAGGSEKNSVLYVLLNAYTRWLSNDSTYPQQAKMILNQYKQRYSYSYSSDLIKVFVPLLEALTVPGVIIGKLVSEAFVTIEQANQDLKSGQLALPKLDYDMSYELASLLYQITQRPLVLILDAWEKSYESFQSEYRLLDRFLDKVNEWPHCHFYLGVRDGSSAPTNGIYQCIEDWGSRDKFKTYKLPLMHLNSSEEKNRVITYINHNISGSSLFEPSVLLNMIGGYPSVLERWISNARTLEQIDDKNRYEKLADDANRYRYRELPVIFRKLTVDQRKFATRVALFPRLNNKQWEVFQEILLGECDLALIDELTQRFLFEKEEFPFYGHDTRHTAVNKLLVTKYSHTYKEQAELLIWDLASKAKGFNPLNVQAPFLLLAYWSKTLNKLILKHPTKKLLECAKSLIYDEMLDVDSGDFKSCDYISVMPLVTEALNNRSVKKCEMNDIEGAILDCTAVIELPEAPSSQVSEALYNRGVAKSKSNDIKGAIEDYTTVIEMPEASTDQVAKAFTNRGIIKKMLNDADGANADYIALFELHGAPVHEIAKALSNI